MTTERFRNYDAKETLPKDPQGAGPREVREVQEGEATLTMGLGARPSGEDFEDAPFTENVYADGDVLERLGEAAHEAHEASERRHDDQDFSPEENARRLAALSPDATGARKETTQRS